MATPVQQINLLIVEDDEDDYILTNDLLQSSESFRITVEWIKTPEAARQTLIRNEHDICLMDYRLGSDVGVDLVRDAIDCGFSGPIIMLTGQDDSGVEVEAAQAGAVDYLVKEHLSLEQLQRSIRYALARSEIQSERIERLRAESANRSKTEFLATLSHEIRTPLTSILGYTELLIDQYSKDTALVEKLGVVDRNGKHLLSLLNDTLDLSKIEAGKFEIEIAPLELGPFLNDIISLSRTAAEEKGLQFRFSSPDSIPRFIHSDATRLRQILLNLLGNAVKFTHQGRIDFKLKFSSDAGPDEDIQFIVEDSGKGIEQLELERIFEPFTQLNSDTEFQQGTGLGLTISRQLVHKLDGNISVKSTPGKGSQFTLTFPSQQPAEWISADNISTETRNTAGPPVLDIDGRILIVDDVEDVRNLIGNILHRANSEIMFAANGQEAIDILRDKTLGADIELVLMDLNMPQMNGYEAIQVMKEDGIRVPVIALTAASLEGEKEKCEAMGFSGYLSKPITASRLIACIQEILTASQDPGPAETSPKTHSILVVEDNADAGRAVSQLLQHLGHTAYVATGYDEALEYCERSEPDILLSDINLGKSSGLELAQYISQTHPSIRIFIISGDSAALDGPMPGCVQGTLIKPVSLASLLKILA